MVYGLNKVHSKKESGRFTGESDFFSSAHWRERLLCLALVLAPVHLVKGNYLFDILGRDRDMRELTKRLAFTLVFLVRDAVFYSL